MISQTELAEQLGVDNKQIGQWVRLGMPWHGKARKRAFDPLEVRAWLVNQGHAAEDGPGLVTSIAQVATHFDVSERTVTRWRSQGMPGEYRGNGRPGLYALGEIEAWLKRKGLWGTDANDELLTTGDRSPALEAYRQEKALLAKLDRLEREGRLIDVGEMRRRLIEYAAMLRKMAEGVARDYGPGPAERIEQATNEFARMVQKDCRREDRARAFTDDADDAGR
jgi:phage terminase Nu1 subunit (DNA packaging protein)